MTQVIKELAGAIDRRVYQGLKNQGRTDSEIQTYCMGIATNLVQENCKESTFICSRCHSIFNTGEYTADLSDEIYKLVIAIEPKISLACCEDCQNVVAKELHNLCAQRTNVRLITVQSY